MQNITNEERRMKNEEEPQATWSSVAIRRSLFAVRRSAPVGSVHA